MNTYKKEWTISVLCFALVAITGGFLSMFFIFAKDALFYPEEQAYLYKSTILGFPTHYFLLLIFSWLGATLIAAFYSWYMDKLDRKIGMEVG
jgi:putative solute:sodium symporter small subunit